LTRINKKIFAYPQIVHGKQTKGKVVVQIVKNTSNGYMEDPVRFKRKFLLTIIQILSKKTI